MPMRMPVLSVMETGMMMLCARRTGSGGGAMNACAIHLHFAAPHGYKRATIGCALPTTVCTRHHICFSSTTW